MSLTETEVCMRYITPALEEAGWNKHNQILREYYFTDGRVFVRGNTVARGKAKKADYLLQYKANFPLAIVEAKKDTLCMGDGLQQAINYGDILDIPFVYSSNGKGFIEHDRLTGREKEISINEFPSPKELYERYTKLRKLDKEQEEVYFQDFFYKLGAYTPRYYQRIAINRTVEAVVKGQKRISLVMATGTGKTFTAFQIIHRLWKTGNKKRILFLADRNILVDQTMTGDFSPFGDKMTKIKRDKISHAHEIYLALYQSMTGSEDWQKAFLEYSPDFFDLVVVDECHRGSAKDNSAWRKVLDYFDQATHIGMTATPKEDKDVSTQGYFGEPVYTYSLKQGIDDGFLAPYKVVRIGIDKDLMGYRPIDGELDKYGRVIEDREYYATDFERNIVLENRRKLVAKAISDYMRDTLKDRFAKTIVFCQNIEHAEAMRMALSNENADLVKENSKYVMRITGDNPEGKLQLDNFIEPTEKYPVIATTSKLMTTGVDAKTCKLIVLDMNIGSMTEFKQIIGRGTRLRPDHDKYFFTIMDFTGATRIFSDPDFDGIPELDEGYAPSSEETTDDQNCDNNKLPKPLVEEKIKFYVDNTEVTMINKRVQYLDSNGKLISESYIDYTKKNIKSDYASLDQFINRWNSEEKKQIIYDELLSKGIILEKLREELGKEDIDDFDLICHIAFDMKPLTKSERVNNVKKSKFYQEYSEKAREVIEILLDKYMNSGIQDIEDIGILKLDDFKKIGMPGRIMKLFGGKNEYMFAIRSLEKELYRNGVA